MCSTEQMNTKVLDCLLTLHIKVCLGEFYCICEKRSIKYFVAPGEAACNKL